MKKENTRKNKIVKILKWCLLTVGILLVCLFSIPSIFGDTIANEIKKGINANLKTELQFKNSSISFFRHFPSLTFSFEEVNLTSTEPFEEETLVTAQELGFGINVFKLIFSDKVVIEGTYLTDCNIKLIKDKFGRNNYDVYKATDTLAASEKDTSAQGLNLNLRRLKIENATVLYKDEDMGITVSSNGLDYNGRGGLVDGKLELGSRLDIDNVNVVFDNIDYLNGKKLKARSFTIYDTENLSIELDKNTISLNDLEVNFHGNLDIFDEGVAYNLIVNTEDGTLEEVVSALPPKYVEWSKEMTLNGDMDATLRLAGYAGTVPADKKIDQTDLDVDIRDGSIKHINAEQPIKNLYVKLKGSLTDNEISFNLDSLNFTHNNKVTRGHLFASGTMDSLYVQSNIKSNIDLDLLNQTLSLPDLAFNGLLETDFNIDGVYRPETSKLPKTKGIFKLTNGYLKTSGYPEPIKNIELNAVLKNEGQTYEASSITINALNFTFLENQFTSKAYFKNFDSPEYDIQAKGSIDFTALNQVVDLPFLIKDGQLIADANLKGRLDNDLEENENSGTLGIKNIKVKTDLLPYEVRVKEGQFLFLNERMAFSKLDIEHRSSQINMDGYFTNYLDYALSSEGTLRGDVNLHSPNIDITEFFPTEEIQQPLDSIGTVTAEEVVSGVMQVPENIDLAITLDIDTLTYNKLDITDLSGNLGLNPQGLFLKKGHMKMVDGTASLSGVYKPVSSEKALFTMDIDAENLNIAKGYNSIDLFKELAPAAAQAAGIMSVDYNLAGTLDDQMLPVLPELSGKGTLKVHSVQFNGYKLMGKVSEKSGFEALNDPKVSEITINSTLNNNVLEMERFKFKVSPFKLRAEGQTTLDGELSLKMRIGLPPFGLLGIPVVIKGNSDDFDVKLGTKSPDLDSLEDTESGLSEEDIQRMSMLKDSIREGMSVDDINKLQSQIQNMKLDSLKTQPVDSLNTIN
ncbi:AsmA family protein [Maribacter sp. MMG018]|uniref:AsmA family protein n=1 Tax=Maribacter sp. MMG018 TaxID=2822688 RepID=UPI001B3781CF|nr:AsmA family protein [Maribacter sp. MMG018]MBQ4912873.1 AsmA family protein [Maribacter sp. MMG018]